MALARSDQFLGRVVIGLAYSSSLDMGLSTPFRKKTANFLERLRLVLAHDADIHPSQKRLLHIFLQPTEVIRVVLKSILSNSHQVIRWVSCVIPNDCQRPRNSLYSVVAKHCHMALSPRRLFVLERFRRDLDGCSDPKQLRDIGHSLFQLYLSQQEAVEGLINQGWLPGETLPKAVQKES